MAKEEGLDNVSSERPSEQPSEMRETEVEKPKRPMWKRILFEPAVQIVIAAALAIAIGVGVKSAVEDIPNAAMLAGIPGMLWLRALKAVVLPLIVCSIIIAVQRLKNMAKGGGLLAGTTIIYYVLTTLLAVIISAIMTSQIWARQMTVAGEEALAMDEEDEEDVKSVTIHEAIYQMFESLVPGNVVQAFAENSLLAVLVTSVVVGALITDPDSPIMRFLREVEVIIMKIINFLIVIAPIGVFFLILPNLFKLPIGEIGLNLGILIGGTVTQILFHLLVVLPIIFFAFTRSNPYSYWIKNASAWITAWGSASSAATMPVTLRCAKARGIPDTVARFSIPLGTLINMDGTAIYFPITVVFLAVTQGISLSPVQYVIICILATVASIGTTPIPSSSLVLTVMIAESVNVPVTGMYGVVVAIDWFLDRFRTALNVSGDLFAVKCISAYTKITDDDDSLTEEEETQIRDEARGERVV